MHLLHVGGQRRKALTALVLSTSLSNSFPQGTSWHCGRTTSPPPPSLLPQFLSRGEPGEVEEGVKRLFPTLSRTYDSAVRAQYLCVPTVHHKCPARQRGRGSSSLRTCACVCICACGESLSEHMQLKSAATFPSAHVFLPRMHPPPPSID